MIEIERVNFEEILSNIENWQHIGFGVYQYYITSTIVYQITILAHNPEFNILYANARLELCGTVDSLLNGGIFFNRSLITEDSVAICLEKAAQDYRAHME